MAKMVKNKANDLQGLRIVTVHQFASDFLTSYQTALKWLKEHQIPVHKVGSKAWICHEDLIRYFEAHSYMDIFKSDTEQNPDVNAAMGMESLLRDKI